jgi:hypothetical protein
MCRIKKYFYCTVFFCVSIGITGLCYGSEFILTRVLDGTHDGYTFSSNGNQVLLLDLDATVYQMHGRGKTHDDDHDHVDADSATVEDGHTEGGCGGGSGMVNFCLQVVDQIEEILCWADRPVSPGWQRDPQMACILPKGQKQLYTVKVFLKGEGENSCGSNPDIGFAEADAYGMGKRFYVLKIRLQDLAEEGKIQAINATGSGFK